jgi:hypothetical protein
MKFLKILFGLYFALLILGCGKSEDIGIKANKASKEKTKNLNVSIFIDLSDRVDTLKYSTNPQYYVRDKECIVSVYDIFIKHITNKRLYDLCDKVNVYFDPLPDDDKITQIASGLKIDLAEKSKDEILSAININRIQRNLDSLYSFVVSRSGHPALFQGSNIWRFFKDEINEKCINIDPSYRNILIVFTDGYMYWPEDKRREGNKYNYIEREYAHFNKFRNKDSLNKFSENKYGFIPVQKDLSKLEIVVINIAPDKKYPQDYDIIRQYWEEWFKGMNVKKYKIIKSGLPINMEQEIKEFIVN